MNIADNIGRVQTQGGGLNQQVLSGQTGFVGDPLPLTRRYKYVRERIIARARVLEYIEAQLNMDLFKEDVIAAAYFEEAMVAALERLK
jgi:hypothetical protein